MTVPPFDLASLGLLTGSVRRTLHLIHHLGIPLTDISRFHLDPDLDVSFDTPHGTLCPYQTGADLRSTIGLCADDTLDDGHPDTIIAVRTPAEYAALRRPLLSADDGEISMHRETFLALAQYLLRVNERNGARVQMLLGVISALLTAAAGLLTGLVHPLLLTAAALTLFAALSAAQQALVRVQPGAALTLLRLTGLGTQAATLPAHLAAAEDVNGLLRAHASARRAAYHHGPDAAGRVH